MKPKLLFYCQHVLGMGHLVRSRELVRAMDDFDVWFLNGGEPVEGFVFPSNVRMIQLPPIASDIEFRDIDASEATRLERREMLANVFAAVRPDIFLVEMFPFGRRKFAFELLPVLEAKGDTCVVSSVRDVLVSKRDQERHEDFACRTLNACFDLVLVHSDPRFQSLGETFHRLDDLRIPVEYTGFVAEQAHTANAIKPDLPHIVASVGGGRVGYELLDAVIEASARLRFPHTVDVYTGPYQPEGQLQALRSKAAPWICVDRFAPDFAARLSEAHLSISLGGYNTCMNIVTAGVKALVFPFAGNGNEEQTVRARKLEQLGALRVLTAADLDPARLASLIETQLAAAGPARPALDFDGARKTAALLARRLQYV